MALQARLDIFFAKNSGENCDKFRLMLKGKEVSNDSDNLDEEIDAIIDNWLEYRSSTRNNTKITFSFLI